MAMMAGKLKVIPPTDWSDSPEVHKFLDWLDGYQDVRGVPTLILYINKYKDTERILKGHMEQIQRSLRFVNGIRPGVTGRRSTMEYVARRFYDKMSNRQLHQHCDFNKLNYFDYPDRESVIEALTERQVRLAKEQPIERHVTVEPLPEIEEGDDGSEE